MNAYRLFIGLLLVVFLESCRFSPKSQYDIPAEEFCECASPHYDKFSEDLKKDINEVANKHKGSEGAMQILLDKRMEKSSTSIAREAILMEVFSVEMDKCLNKIFEQHARNKATNSQSWDMDSLLNSLKQKDDCVSLSAAVFLLKPPHIETEN